MIEHVSLGQPLELDRHTHGSAVIRRGVYRHGPLDGARLGGDNGLKYRYGSQRRGVGRALRLRRWMQCLCCARRAVGSANRACVQLVLDVFYVGVVE